MARQTITFGDVQHQVVQKLRANLLNAGGADHHDLNFTEGVNLAIVTAVAFMFADEYRDRNGLHPSTEGDSIPYDAAAADIVAHYLTDDDLPGWIKQSYAGYVEGFANMAVMADLYPEPGQPDSEWYDGATVADEEELDRIHTATVGPGDESTG